jgi:fatty aldehyde decarbonylase
MVQMAASLELDFSSATYKDAYSRINAIVIEGEQEAYEN